MTANGFERREEPEPDRVPPLGLVGSAALFGAGALLLFLTTRVAVPALVSATGAETVVMWFLAASVVLFGPLLLGRPAAVSRTADRKAGVMARAAVASPDEWRRLAWAVGGFAAVGVLTGGIGAALGALEHESRVPSFLHGFRAARSRPLLDSRRVAAVFCAQHPRGRVRLAGVRAAAARGCLRGRAWLVNGILWLLFHAAFPWQVLVTLVPITLILPYIVQRRRSTWVGVAIHAGFGAAGFLVLAFGLA